MKTTGNKKNGELLVFVLMAICSGVIIGVGGFAFLTSVALLGGWGRLIGGLLFSLGIFVIVTFEMRLFTGMVADIPEMKAKELWKLAVCFIGNALGVALSACIAYCTPLGGVVSAQGAEVIAAKLQAENWAVSALCSSILCGVLITLSVKSAKAAPQKGLSATVGVIFPIVVFAFCGFDHSVANMLYLYYLGEFSWQIVGYVLLTIAGNILGGVALPLVLKYKNKVEKEQQENQENNEN